MFASLSYSTKPEIILLFSGNLTIVFPVNGRKKAAAQKLFTEIAMQQLFLIYLLTLDLGSDLSREVFRLLLQTFAELEADEALRLDITEDLLDRLVRILDERLL